MTRTTVVPEASDSALSGATILPGVPLPSWGRPAEPALPDPPPAPPVEAATSAPDPVETASPRPELVVPPPVVAEARTEPEIHRPRSHRRDAAAVASVAAAPVVTFGGDSQVDTLEAPVPQLAPPTPVAPRAEVYAAAGAAPPTAPWGTPPADLAEVARVEPTHAGAADVAPEDASPVDVEDDDDHAEPAPPRPRRALVVLGAVGGVLVLGAVAAFVWPGLLVTEDQPSASPRPAVSVAGKVTLAAPDSVSGLQRISGAPAAALTKAAAGTTLAGYTAPVAAVYGTGTTPTATVIAWKASAHGADADVSTAFAGYQQATGRPVTGIAPVETGKLGGRMSCGSGMLGTTPASVCFWADDATFGAVTVLRPADAKAGAVTAVAIRTAMETRS